MTATVTQTVIGTPHVELDFTLVQREASQLVADMESAARSSNPDHYAYVADEGDPSSWRLPLYNADGEPVQRLVSYALGRLSPDAEPNVPARRMREVRARIAVAWRQLHPGEDTLPKPLTKADTFSTDELVVQPSGVMVAFGIDPAAAQALLWQTAPPGTEAEPIEQLHLTLAYMGDVVSFTDEDLADMAALLQAYASGEYPLSGSVSGGAVFVTEFEQASTSGAAVALADVPGLAAFRTRLTDLLQLGGYWPIATHDFQPHVTLGYGPVEALQTAPLPPTVPLTFDSLMLVAGGRVWRFPLTGATLDRIRYMSDPGVPAQDYPSPAEPVAMGVWCAAEEEKRITYAPLYAPDLLDTHGEWMTADAIEEMVATYLRGGCFGIRLQHVPMTQAGECIGIMCWPFEVEAVLRTAEGLEHPVTFPAGTAFQAVRWSEWAWGEVKTGNLRGLSFGGWAFRTDAAPGGAPATTVPAAEPPPAVDELPQAEPVTGAEDE